ncbi:CGNR zinc finger domain-containing protein [Cellulomonas sp. McL0617]|uniref:CGNR zinc finger domain-containing protein n=1 Tax=Cellulomonas sp. McL0617 TaxID=3415675 RepID=UPI003CF7F62C
MRDVGSADAAVRAEIPAAALVVKDFVNSADLAAGTESLTSPATLVDWLHDHGLARRAPELSRADLEQVAAVREGLRQLLLVNAGHTPDHDVLARFNAALASTSLVAQFDADGRRALLPVEHRPAATVVAELLDIVDRARSDDTWGRLKVCARDECRWAYYDASRNRSGRWCSMIDCGNRVKMKRAYAARSGRTAT